MHSSVCKLPSYTSSQEIAEKSARARGAKSWLPEHPAAIRIANKQAKEAKK